MTTVWWVAVSLCVGYGCGVRVCLYYIRKAAKQAAAKH